MTLEPAGFLKIGNLSENQLADMEKRRKVDFQCIRETKKKGSKIFRIGAVKL